MRNPRHCAPIAALVCLALAQAGCTEKKAQALVVAAQTFASEAKGAVQNVRALYLADISSPDETFEKQSAQVAEDIKKEILSGSSINDEKFAELLKGTTLSNPALSEINQEFDLLERAYSTFASMYESLPQGYLFSRQAVKNSEKHAINLTVQLINMAEEVEKHPLQFRGRRILLQERLEDVAGITNEELRQATIGILSKEIVHLRQEEEKANQQAILQCLRAAEAGKRVAQLIRDYDKLSLEDILTLTGDALGFASAITDSADVKALVAKYNGIRETIENDPYWAPLLDKAITDSGGTN